MFIGKSSAAAGVCAAAILSLLEPAGGAFAQPAAPASPPVTVDNEGMVRVPATDVPVSEYLTPEGKAYLAQHLNVMRHPELLAGPNGTPKFLEDYIARQEALYPVTRQDTSIGGVHVFVYTPKAGVTQANFDRVLINLHGGGFAGCWPGCAELESIPIAGLGRFKVVSVDYREGPRYRYPAASEDVAAVYAELLKTHRPENIGIYGCSAGGMQTGMSVAWFQTHSLPRPGAIGIFCAGLTLSHGQPGGGDSIYTAMPIGEARLSLPTPGAGPPGQPSQNYLTGVDPNDPDVAPVVSPEVLAHFPPTLFVTGTRGMELSSAVYSHSLLVKAGVDAELHVWEGMFHGFFYNPDVPESRDCYDVIVKFFDHHLGRS